MAEVAADRHNDKVFTVSPAQRASSATFATKKPPKKKKTSKVKHKTCVFHGRFGKEAKSCRLPGYFVGNG